MSAKPAVCVVDDDEAHRNALKLLFRSKNIPYLSFASGDEFFEGYQEKNVGCVLLDLRLSKGGKGPSGLDLLREMRTKGIFLPVILLTGHADVPTTVEAIQAGAVDVVEKPFQDSELLERVQAAFNKGDRLKKILSERHEISPRFETLTPREVEVLDHIVAGEKPRNIAVELGISPKTLDIHRANIMRKIRTRTVAELVRWRLLNRADELGTMPLVQRT
jgi:two-component system, LuxR family, response regulator FixJ